METKEEFNREFYFSTGNKKNYIIYDSDIYKLSELDILSLIKICFVEGRSKSIGRKILEMYRNVHESDNLDPQNKLSRIGIIENGKREPTRTKKFKRI